MSTVDDVPSPAPSRRNSRSGSLRLSSSLPDVRPSPRSLSTRWVRFATSEGRREGADEANESDFAWYHSIELGPGRVTDGLLDHRELVHHLPIDNDLSGMRVLDVGTADGFWAFEFERRGAEVVAIDIDQLSEADLPPPIAGALVRRGADRRMDAPFNYAKQQLGSKVERISSSIYQIGTLGLEPFDLVFASDVLCHLERPTQALRVLREVTRGKLLLIAVYDPSKPDGDVEYGGGWQGVWWIPSLTALAQMTADAGFRVGLDLAYTFDHKGFSAPGQHPWRAVLSGTVRDQKR